MITHKQLTLAETFENCQESLKNDTYNFISLLESSINFDEIVPTSFVSNYHARTGRQRKYQLYPMLKALVLQRIFSVPTISLLIIILRYSQELRDYCGFDKVPDASKFTRFKQDFLLDLQLMFDNLVDITEPICQDIDTDLASMTIFDTSGVEAFVTENNPKYINNIIKRLKSFKKDKQLNDSYDPYKAAYASMPSHANSNAAIQQMYINGHFCYSYKFGIITNGLGIIRDLTFYNKEFLEKHPEIVVEKKEKSPDEDKSLADSKALTPVLRDFFAKHPLINPKTFLGDAAFDTIEIYQKLFREFKFEKALIPLKSKLIMTHPNCKLDGNGIPCCPNDSSLPMKREGSKSHLRCGIPSIKFVCPKMKWVYNKETKSSKRVSSCEQKCTSSPCGRMFYIYPEKDLRAYPGVLRNSDEWSNTYKIRTTVEKSIQQVKDSFCVAKSKTQNEKTIHADLLLAGITQLISVLVANKIHKRQYIKSLKPLIAG